MGRIKVWQWALGLLFVAATLVAAAYSFARAGEDGPRATQVGIVLIGAGLAALLVTLFLRFFREEQRLEQIIEERTRDAEQKTSLLTAIFDSAPLVMFCKDIDLNFTTCNKHMRKVFRLGDDEMPNGGERGVFSGGQRFAENSDRMVISAKRPVRFEETVAMPWGEELVFEVVKAPLRQADGEVTGIVGIARDVTQRKKAEERARDAEERMRLMLNAAPLSITMWDKNYRIIACSYEARRMLGLPDEGDIYEDFLRLIPERQPNGRASLEFFAEEMGKAFERGRNRQDWVHTNALGEPVPMDVHMVRMKHKGNDVLAAYARDLREQDAMIAKIEETSRKRAEAEAASIAKTKFLAAVSHEMRTPMNTIMGIAELHMQNEALPFDLAESMNRIYQSGDILFGIISDLIDVSQMETGKFKLKPENYELASVLNDVAQLNIMENGSKPVVFSLYVDENLPAALFGDAVRIKQVVNNIVSNAFKYTDHGMVSLEALCEPGEVEDMTTLVFEIADTGPGMAPEELKELYDEFARFDNTTMGLGLGLSIAKRLVGMMDGSIDIESSPGMGTVFTLRLPQKKAGEATIGKELAENLMKFKFATFSQMHKAQIVRDPMPYGSVLVVDDVDSNLYVAKLLLQPYGLKIETAVDAFDALNKIKQGSIYDIVFMDHMMPLMDGVEATKQLRALGYGRTIVALSANALPGHAEMFLESGFDGFVSKPIDTRELNAALNKWIRDKQPPEVIEAARREAEGNARRAMASASENTGEAVTPELAALFIRDAQKAIKAIEKAHYNSYGEEDMGPFLISVHAIKAALANIGENELAETAQGLEQAARVNNTEFILGEGLGFMQSISDVIEKLKPLAKSEELAEEEELADSDRAYLTDMLVQIRVACGEYDKKTAKAAMAGLSQRKWPHHIKDKLDEISERILHSDFEEAAQAADAIGAEQIVNQ
jgi:PAS domain S-box-containing protein